MKNPLLFSVAAIFLFCAPDTSIAQAGNPDSSELKLVAQLPPELPQRIMGLAYDGNKLWATIYLGRGSYATLDPAWHGPMMLCGLRNLRGGSGAYPSEGEQPDAHRRQTRSVRLDSSVRCIDYLKAAMVSNE